MNEKQEIILGIFEEAKKHGLAHNQKEFAVLVDVNASTLSQALAGNEKYLSDRMVRRVQRWAQEHLKEEKPAHESRPDIVIPAATMDLYTCMAKSIDRLTAMVERLQPGAGAFSGIQTAPKNYRLDK